MVIDWLAAGIDPAQATLFIQSRLPEHAELHALLSMITAAQLARACTELQGPTGKAHRTATSPPTVFSATRFCRPPTSSCTAQSTFRSAKTRSRTSR